MKKLILFLIVLFQFYSYSQSTGQVAAVAGLAALTFVAVDAGQKEMAKEITQFRSKEYIMNHIIGPTNGKSIRFETESLVSDNSAGLISVAFNCDEVNERGLLLAFFGNSRDEQGNSVRAYAFRYIPLKEAQDFFDRINEVKKVHKDYISDSKDVNNVYVEHEDIKLVIYRDGGEQIRVFWNGFEVIWEKSAFQKTDRRLDKWFN